MRRVSMVAAGLVLAMAVTGCGQSEAERQAEQARKAAEEATRQVEKATARSQQDGRSRDQGNDRADAERRG